MSIHKLTKSEKVYFRNQYMQEDFPHVVAVSVGRYKCTRKCRMCPMYNIPVSNKAQMTKEVMTRVCDVVGERSVQLEISAYGETFTHPQADEFMFLARQKCQNAEIMFVTNGSTITEERAEKIVDSGIDILQFSLDAGSPETYKWLTGSNAYDQVCQNLEKLVEVREKRGGKHLKIQTHMIGLKELEHEFDDFIKRWEGKVDLAKVRDFGNWAGMVDDNGITPSQVIEVPDVRYPCAYLWYCSKIEPTGDVVKCFVHTVGESEEKLGNIMEEDFINIWQGAEMKRTRTAHLNNEFGQFDHCSTCSVWSLFHKFWDRKKIAGIIPTKTWV